MKVRIEIARGGERIMVGAEVEDHVFPLGRVELGEADPIAIVAWVPPCGCRDGATGPWIEVGDEVTLTAAEQHQAETAARRKAIRGFEDAAAAAGESSSCN